MPNLPLSCARSRAAGSPRERERGPGGEGLNSDFAYALLASVTDQTDD